MAPRNSQNTQTVAQKDRARRAVDLKIAGATWPQIAEELNFQTEAGARLLVARYFEQTAKAQFEEMHPIVLERAEALWRKAWSRLNSIDRQVGADGRPLPGSIDDWDKAMRQCVNVLQSLARISGLGNGPVIQVNVTTAADISALRDEFYQLRGLSVGQVLDADVVDGDVVEEADSTGVNGDEWQGKDIGLPRHTNGHANGHSNGNGVASDE